MSDAILQPGRNCWRHEHADRLAFLVNGAAYFSAVKRALLAAREQVFIVGWDIDSRIRLERRAPMPDVPDELLALIRHVAEARPDLRIYVLIWDFTLLYAGDREPIPSFKLNWQTPPNVVARYDDALPVGGAQHQKVVVVDDRLAFVGGLDLTEGRWDTAEHAENDPDRVDCHGQPYGPYHDIMAMFDGPAAAAIGELARERWSIATGETPSGPARQGDGNSWPDTVEPDIANLSIAIARNQPPIDGIEGRHEIEPLILDSIAAARDLIFIENQYFTARSATEALCGRLREDDGPEVVIVLPERYSGWMEDQTMGAGLARAVEQMKAADRHGRLCVLAPRLGHKSGMRYTIHAKVMTVDDRLVHVGSANLNNRSMSIDSECDIAVEADGDDRIGAAISALRWRLLSEHCAVNAEALASSVEKKGSVIAALESLDANGRCLAPLIVHAPEGPAPEMLNSFADPENPADFSEFARRVMQIDLGTPGLRDTFRRAGPLLAAVAAVAVIAAGWRYTPLAGWIEPKAIAEWFEAARGSLFAPALAIGIFVLAGFVVFPVTVLIAGTAIAFGPWLGFAYAFAGAMVSAVTMFAIGSVIGRPTLRRLAGKHLRTLDRYLGRSGVMTIMTVRMIPIAPFTVVNLAAGAARVRVVDFLIGSVLGLAPGIAIITAMGDQLETLLRNPTAWNTAALAALLVLWLMVGVAIQHLLRRRLRGRAVKTADGGAGSS